MTETNLSGTPIIRLIDGDYHPQQWLEVMVDGVRNLVKVYVNRNLRGVRGERNSRNQWNLPEVIHEFLSKSSHKD